MRRVWHVIFETWSVWITNESPTSETISIEYGWRLDGADVSESDWGPGGPRFQSYPRLTFQSCSHYQLNQLGSKAASESTFKKSNTCGVSNTRLFFFFEYRINNSKHNSRYHLMIFKITWYVVFVRETYGPQAVASHRFDDISNHELSILRKKLLNVAVCSMDPTASEKLKFNRLVSGAKWVTVPCLVQWSINQFVLRNRIFILQPLFPFAQLWEW